MKFEFNLELSISKYLVVQKDFAHSEPQIHQCVFQYISTTKTSIKTQTIPTLFQPGTFAKCIRNKAVRVVPCGLLIGQAYLHFKVRVPKLRKNLFHSSATAGMPNKNLQKNSPNRHGVPHYTTCLRHYSIPWSGWKCF